MYLTMDNIGDDIFPAISNLNNETEKWDEIAHAALTYGFAGIHVTSTYYRRLGFPTVRIPEGIRELFRLTYHVGGIYLLSTPDDEEQVHARLSESLAVAASNGMEDVSLHPPFHANVSMRSIQPAAASPDERNAAKRRLHSVLSAWIPRFLDRGITLSLETHVTPSFFVFSGLQDFQDFALSLPELGVLVDVSHNHYDGYSAADFLSIFGSLNINGLHISDAVRGVDFEEGTHLPVGKGEIDFGRLLGSFDGDDSVYGALEVKAPSQGIAESLIRLQSLT